MLLVQRYANRLNIIVELAKLIIRFQLSILNFLFFIFTSILFSCNNCKLYCSN